jgi:hypothetical protein
LEQLSSGVVGLVVGAVLGLTLSVFFEDALKRVFATSSDPKSPLIRRH